MRIRMLQFLVLSCAFFAMSAPAAAGVMQPLSDKKKPKDEGPPSVVIDLGVLDQMGVPDPDRGRPAVPTPPYRPRPSINIGGDDDDQDDLKPEDAFIPVGKHQLPRTGNWSNPHPPAQIKLTPPSSGMPEPLTPATPATQGLQSYQPPDMFGNSPQENVSASPLEAVPAGDVMSEVMDGTQVERPVRPARPVIQTYVIEPGKSRAVDMSTNAIDARMKSAVADTKKAYTKKPAAKGPLPSEIKENDLVQPTALDVLKSIGDDDAKGPVPGTVAAAPVTAVTPVPMQPAGVTASLVFQRTAIVLDSDMKKQLDSQVLPQLAANPASKIAIQSLASSTQDGGEASRRLSLARAMEVQDYLLLHKIGQNRIDIRALGSQGPPEPQKNIPDRVDIYIHAPSNH